MIYVIDFFAAIEDEAKPRFMTDLCKIYFPKKTLHHTEIPNSQLSIINFPLNSLPSILHPPHQPRKHLPWAALHKRRHAGGEHQSFTFCQHFLNSGIITPIIPKRKHENRFVILTIND